MKKTARIVIYKDRRNDWRWRLLARNGRIVADCAEGNGYTTKSGVIRAIASAKLYMLEADIAEK
jgi:hypothetical protein